MDNSNWRPADQSQGHAENPSMDGGDWRTKIPAVSRQKIVIKIMDTLKRHLPLSGQDGLHELKKFAVRFEDKIFSAAVNQPDYLHRISLKMLSMESKSQNPAMSNRIQHNQPTGSNRTPEPASQNMQSQVQNPGQSLSIPSANIQPQPHTQLSQNIQTSISSAGVQGSVLAPVSGLTQTPIQNSVGRNSNMLNISGIMQNPLGNSIGQGAASSMFASSQKQMPMRQPSQQQQQQYIYQQSIQPQLKPMSNHGNMPQSFMQSHIQQQQQQQQQNILQPNQLQLSQQSLMQTSSVLQPSLVHSAPVTSLQQNQQSPVQQSTQSVLQQHQQSLLRQQQQNATNMQPNPILVQQNNVSDIQFQQQLHYQQRQPVMTQQNSLPSAQQQQQQLSSQNNASGIPQPLKLIGSHSGNSMQSCEHSGHMLQQTMVQQQTQQTVPALLSSQGQHSHGQQRLLSQPFSMQQQQTLLKRDMQRVPASGLLQPETANDQQRQIFQSTRPNPEASSNSTAETGNVNMSDWKEDVFQKIQIMKEKYLPELSEVHQKISLKIQHHESLHQQPRPPQFERLKWFKTLLEHAIAFLQVTKSDITLALKEKLGTEEKQIANLLNMSRLKKPVAPPQGQLSSTNLQSFQRGQQQQSQIVQVHSHENQMNHQLQSVISQGPVAPVPQNSMTSLQHGVNSFSGSQNVQPSMINALQAAPNVESGQGNELGSLQQVAVGPLQQNPVSVPQTNGVKLLPTNQSNSSMLQQQNLKQQQGQQMLQAQQLKNQQFLHHQPQLMQKQLQPQQQQHPPSQQLRQPISLQANPMSQLQPMTDANDLKMKQVLNVKPGVFQQHPLAGQSLKSAYHHQQLKPGSDFPASSPPVLQAASPQVPQQASQFDQPNMPNIQKTGASFQIPNSTYITPSPSTPLVPSPLPGDPEKRSSSISSHSNTVNVSHQQGTGAVTAAQSLAIGTPGISASPLLAEASSPDVNKEVSIAVSGKSSLTEQPLERLLRVVKTVSSQALSSAVDDIASVVSMIDRVAGSAPGNGSRAAVGEDLVAMTKCRLQAKNIASLDGTSGTRKMRRRASAMPLNITSSAGSVTDSFKQLNGAASSDLESTATSSSKRPRIEANHALVEEIKEINQHLIDTVVDVGGKDSDPNASAQGSEGTIVKCCYLAVSLSPNLKSQYSLARMSPIMSIRVLVPSDYPNCSPVILDKIPVEISKGNEDLQTKVKARFNMALRSLAHPMSLWDVARTWDVCMRTVITEYAVLKGGGTFSTRYGTWEKYSIEA